MYLTTTYYFYLHIFWLNCQYLVHKFSINPPSQHKNSKEQNFLEQILTSPFHKY